MAKKLLYSITALFDTPEKIISAAEVTSKKGYKKFDVHTPYPLHDLDRAMKLKKSGIGYFALIFGLIGAVSSILFISWVTLSDYPLIIGGKPFWSWPAFVPIAFELTVLSTVVFSTIVLIVKYFRFPNNSHPLHDTRYMKSVSSDKFGISIQASDPKFNEEKVKKFFKAISGKNILPIYIETDDRKQRKNLFELKFLGLLAIVALVVSGVTYYSLNRLLFLQPFNWMAEQDKLKAQQGSDLFKDRIGMRPPVEGTVARGFIPYQFNGKPEDAGKYLVNPLIPTKNVLDQGKRKYLTFCTPCHGNFARGDSRLQGQFPNPPTLHSDKVRQWPDGNIYHVITVGQNAMPGYALQISPEIRWAVICYVRTLQRAQNARESDLK